MTVTIGGVAMPQVVIGAVEKQRGVMSGFNRIEYRKCSLHLHVGFGF